MPLTGPIISRKYIQSVAGNIQARLKDTWIKRFNNRKVNTLLPLVESRIAPTTSGDDQLPGIYSTLSFFLYKTAQLSRYGIKSFRYRIEAMRREVNRHWPGERRRRGAGCDQRRAEEGGILFSVPSQIIDVFGRAQGIFFSR